MAYIQRFLESNPEPGHYVLHTQGEGSAIQEAPIQKQAGPSVHEGLQFGGQPFQHIMNLIRHPATLTNLGR